MTKILYINIEDKNEKENMREFELNTIMGMVSDPIKSAVNIADKKLVGDIQRIVRVMEISKEQSNKHRILSIRNMATMHLVLSNN